MAVAALRRRGYQGPVYLSPNLTDPRATRLTTPAFEDALLSLSPAFFAQRLPPTAPTFTETRRYAAATARLGAGPDHAYGAYAWDAVLLLRAALEQTLAYGLDLTDTRRFRQALRDALVGMPPLTGAAAVYNYREDDHSGVDPRSLVIARVTRSGLELDER